MIYAYPFFFIYLKEMKMSIRQCFDGVSNFNTTLLWCARAWKFGKNESKIQFGMQLFNAHLLHNMERMLSLIKPTCKSLHFNMVGVASSTSINVWWEDITHLFYCKYTNCPPRKSIAFGNDQVYPCWWRVLRCSRKK